MTRVAAVSAVLALTGGLTVASSGPARAEVVLHESARFEGAIVHEDFCGVAGLSVEDAYAITSSVMATRQGRDGLVYFLERMTETSTLTDLRTGATVSFARRGSSSKDLTVTDNGDGTLSVLVRVVGMDVVYDSAGAAIARNPGQIRVRLTIDSAGTPADPFDDQLLAAEQVTESTGRNDDMCAATLAAWGY